ncbi:MULTISPECIES: phosphate ABC transporter substrate-binding protein PstS [unclassified Novosphingobium]|uniref:phosphate ABC transporter substrate-binding protein PstS n=1 Tax=unclassified Novosphingobium TaxID=2644732 RepID=UPI00086F4039|nr:MULTISPECIES: phosphate ABC transporter substrate-binding protein PstS [unclassified Novosphingobium]MBN9145592.1 phosphate ABC transporter substrate-binding protein PstS [Novosphingobium sp.]MDR6709467.1 phosphate transport system substrate-binding protein [Novosphingobium sp. 1748]ODU80791.1 MAG: phosphate ABC transporter substrate-binding protein PstS [Novosphingobium sp. SCN 63-17]OJX87940.1 MAG: phosphate ABC transporter substrate-binding protein PstS [Novosphingobium sp. 63-713]
MFRKTVLAFGLGLAMISPAWSESFTGAGASFPASLYQAWAREYAGASGDQLNYQSIGSGGGVRQIIAHTVDFGATDKPLKPEELNKAGLVQFPAAIGGVVPVFNLPGIGPGQLRLSGGLLGDIFLGRIKRWNDPRIAALNPGLKLPPFPITVVHRADGSGTTFLFTSYLAQTSPAWARAVGASDAVKWPAGIGGKGNDGVAAFVRQTYGALGYVEYIYARKGKVSYARVQNSAGQFPTPEPTSFAAAASAAPWGRAAGNYVLLLNQPGAGAWPISGATFILMHREQERPEKGRAVLRFFDWAFARGDATAARLSYVPLPASLKAMVRQQWRAIGGGK